MNDHVDMAQFVEAKSDQLNADDLIGAPRTITVRKVSGNDGDQPVSIHFDGDNGKPFKPCKTMRRVLLAVWGRNAADYVGRSMTLYRDDTVQFGGLNVGGIRISHMSHIDKDMVVVAMKSKGKKAPIKVEPLVIAHDGNVERDAYAQKLTADTLDKIKRAPDADKLRAFIDGRMSKLATLQTDYPEMWTQVDDALRLRLESLAPEPGRATYDMGDGFTD